ncbi:hypothetical protein D3C87_1625640 [compost metagenome]
MRANANAIFFGKANHSRHGIWLAAMKTTGNISRRYDLHHRFVVTEPVRTEAFAHVGVQIDLHRFLPLLPGCPSTHRIQRSLDHL